MITRAPDDEPGELLAAPWSQLIEYGTYAQDPEVQANRLASAISRGWPLNEAIAYPRTLIDVSDEQVRQVATSCRERLVVELAGDPEVLGEPGEQLRRELHTH